MKTIVDNGNNQSIYLLEDDEELNVTATKIEIGAPVKQIVSDYNSTNTIVHENVTPPDDWTGRKYIFDGTDWSLNEDYGEPRSEEAELHAWQIEPLTDEKIAAGDAYYEGLKE